MRKKTIIIEDAPSDGSGQPSRGRWLLGIAQSAFGLKRYGIGICLFLFAGILNTTFAAAPVITSQPTNQTVVAGNNAAFSVTAAGTLLGYQWYQNGSAILLAVGSSYTVLGATSASAGNYTVVVSSLGTSVTSSPAVLIVNKAPAVVTFNNLSQIYNGTARSVSVNTAPIGLIFSLTYNGNTSAPTNAGAYAVIATVLDLNYIGSVTNTLVVGQTATTNALTTSANPVASSSNVTFTANLTPISPGGGAPGGNVVFKDETTVLATTALNGSGTATFSTTTLTHGNHTIAAEYAGNGNFTGSTNNLNELIDSAPVAVTQTWQRTPNASLKIRTAALLAGDIDADNDTLSLVSVGTPGVAGAAVAISGPWILYTPPMGYTNADSFSYVIADPSGLQATGTVSVAVLIDTNATPNIGGLWNPTNGVAIIRFNEIPGRTYAVQDASNLLAPTWQTLGTATADALGKFDFTDSTATNLTTRYYRSLN